MERTKIGDIFEVKLTDESKGYIQYIGNDIEQLNADVIRSFKQRYAFDVNPVIEEILNSEIDFYAHVTGVGLGIKNRAWTKYGTDKDIGAPESAFFRSPADPDELRPDGTWGLPKVSRKWEVWRLGEKRRLVNRIKGIDIQANPGQVFQPQHIIEKMNGEYQGFYPSHE